MEKQSGETDLICTELYTGPNAFSSYRLAAVGEKQPCLANCFPQSGGDGYGFNKEEQEIMQTGSAARKLLRKLHLGQALIFIICVCFAVVFRSPCRGAGPPPC